MRPQRPADLLRASDALLRLDRYRDALRCVLQVFESADRDPGLLIGLDPAGSWTPRELLGLMAERCGVSPDPGYRSGRTAVRG